MGYCIEYTAQGQIRKEEFRESKKHGNKFLVMLLAVCLCIALLQHADKSFVRYLIPGDPQITTAAFQELTENIAQGVSWKDSITAFCKEILVNA